MFVVEQTCGSERSRALLRATRFLHRPQAGSCGSRSGFSLVELLLTLVLIVCLAAASVFCYTALHRSANLDEGLNRFQSLVRLAQAEASTTGRKLQLQFPVTDTTAVVESHGKPVLHHVRVMWEPDFLGAPGVYEEYTAKGWSEELVNELVGVTKVRSIQPERPAEPATTVTVDTETESFPETETESAQGPETEDFPVITFYPDGSCDSAEILLASRNEEDHRLLEVRLSGMLGSMSSRLVDHTEGDISSEDTLARTEDPAPVAADADAFDF
jgi:prepilin-type N-terminal cleavage/methylation domain-containing protein